MTRPRAETILRHSKAFLSGSPATQPVLDRVTELVAGSGKQDGEPGQDGSCVAEFDYHYLSPTARIGSSESAGLRLKGRAVLRRLTNGWTVDDEATRALTPTWPQLPKVPNPLS